ncbi:MAG: FAD-binding protein [Slackia sp.]
MHVSSRAKTNKAVSTGRCSRIREDARRHRRRGDILLDEPMAKHTTFLIGGPADAYVIPQSVEEVAAVVRACRRSGVPHRIVGNGSDLLVADEGLRCVVVQILDNLSSVHVEGNFVRAQAGATNEAVAYAAYENGLADSSSQAESQHHRRRGHHERRGVRRGIQRRRCGADVHHPEGDITSVSRDEADWSYRHA